MDGRDLELLKEAAAGIAGAVQCLKKVWERNAGLKSDGFGVVSVPPSEGDLSSSAPDEVQYALSSLSEAAGYVNDVIGEQS